MVKRKSWDEFRSTGLLWFINTSLHVFGWAIVLKYDENNQITDVYPARVKFRGFDEKSNTNGYTKMTRYMKAHADELLQEIEEDQ